nr:ankyrin repeat protein, putative [Kaumoebavirus]
MTYVSHYSIPDLDIKHIHVAAYDGDVNQLKYWIEVRCEDPDAVNYIGDTPLLIATHFGRRDAIKYLISVGASTNVRNDYGHTVIDNLRKLEQK